MTEAPKSPFAATESSATWSTRLAERYRCVLSADLADWLDRECWRWVGHGEYREPVQAESLLADAPDDIWPGLMPADLLPILSNTAGDWLCIRVARDNQASEIVQWYHGGGDWIPWGRRLAEAILFDTLHQRLPSPGRRHATPAESPRGLDQPPSSDSGADDPMVAWALEHLPDPVAELIDPTVPDDVVAQTLLQAGVAEVAVRCELVQAELSETLSKELTPELAHELGLDWHDVVQWFFDIKRMPEIARQRLAAEHGVTATQTQDWKAAEKHCRRVVELSPELAWAWDVIGYSSERDGKIDDAMDAYTHALMGSVFTDQSVRLRTHWSADQAAKFSAARLSECCPEMPDQMEYLRLLCEPITEHRRSHVTDYWIRQAEASQAAGDMAKACDEFHAAGWDLGAEPMTSYGRILDGLTESAESAGQTARAEVARTHRRCLKERYGA